MGHGRLHLFHRHERRNPLRQLAVRSIQGRHLTPKRCDVLLDAAWLRFSAPSPAFTCCTANR